MPRNCDAKYILMERLSADYDKKTKLEFYASNYNPSYNSGGEREVRDVGTPGSRVNSLLLGTRSARSRP
jgi:hypothetical protein